jgi:single-strand DNA-binding protein
MPGRPGAFAARLVAEVVLMPTRTRDEDTAGVSTNEVRLAGRVTTGPKERALPSGDVIVTFRLSMAREPSPMTKGSRQTSDWVDCVAFGARARRSVAAWAVGDRVTVEGALRRRFYRAGDGAATRVEVEVLRAGRARA